MNPPPRLAGLVLAAGASARMGQDKALLAYPGDVPGWDEARPPSFLLACTLKLRAAGAEVFAVLGHNAAEIAHRTEAAGPALVPRWLRNAAYERGQFSSLQVGAAALLAEDAWEAAIVAPVDHPAFAVATAGALAAAWRESAPAIVKPRHAGRNGHPVLYARAVLAAIAAAPAQATARDLQAQFAARTLALEVADPGILRNVDTPVAYAEFCAAAGARRPPSPR